jgi:P-type Ca2+ transporter type 2C
LRRGEVASIVLPDDDFGSIVTTIRLGRRIYDNLRKAISFIFAVHVPIAGLALLPLLFGLPILFRPMLSAHWKCALDPARRHHLGRQRSSSGPRRPPGTPCSNG